MPPAEQVRAALEKIVSSETFSRSERSRELLRYIVCQDLAGNASRLKGFSIAVDVFGKADSFDPSSDPVVRVQAGRLRELLQAYYEAEGRDDPLRIGIPRGSYVPAYTVMEAGEPESLLTPTETAEADAAEPASEAPSPWPLRIGAGAMLAIFAVGLGWVLIQGAAPGSVVQSVANSAAAALSRPASDMLPSVLIEADDANEAVERVERLLRRGLAGFDTVSLRARASADSAGGPSGMSFALVLQPGEAGDSVTVEVQNLTTDKVLVTRQLHAGEPDAALEDAVAGFLSSVVTASGEIYRSLADANVETPVTRCLVLAERYFRDQNPAAHREAYRCVRSALSSGVELPILHAELAALEVQALTSDYDYPRDASIEDALVHARRAVELGPNSAWAHRAMAHVLSLSASRQEALRWTSRAYELNTFDLGMAASYGYALVFAGQYAAGTEMLERAVKALSAHPSWWDYGLFLGRFMLGDMRAAADAVSVLASSRRAHYIAARLIAARATGNEAEAAALLARLRASRSSFAADPAGFFRRSEYPPDMAAKLLAALRDAGFATGS